MAVYGVGLYEKGKYVSKRNGCPTKCYRAWQGIIERCHHPNRLEKHPTYADCKVVEEWLSFQVFAEWWHSQPFHDCEGYHLDKDLLVKGNKTYGPDFCRFVPSALNNLPTSCKASRGEHPIGVCRETNKGVFKAYIKIRGRNKHLGHFLEEKDAFNAYKVAKESYMKELAEEYKSRIADDLYVAISQRIVEIDD